MPRPRGTCRAARGRSCDPGAVQLGRYEVLGLLGRGGAAVVYRARPPGGGEVAIKLLLRRAPEALARFERERRLLGSLDASAGFVPLLDQGDSPEGPFLVMPLLPGGTLRARLEKGPLGLEEAFEV